MNIAMLSRTLASHAACAAALSLAPLCAAQIQMDLPPGFEVTPLSPVMDEPVAMAFAPDGRIFVAEKKGVVRVIQNGVLLPTPFIDLHEEVNGQGDRGLLSIALEPDFINGRHIYLMISVDPTPGEPDEDADAPLIGRILRYQGTVASGGNVAGPNSRHVVLGDTVENGVPCCWTTHGTGTMRFSPDGSLFVSTGEGARYEFTDAGGYSVLCLWDGVITDEENIGAFRSQNLDTLSGKMLRIDPLTGAGLADNPYYTGDPNDNRSRIWLYGLRNPFRFAIKPGTSPGVLYIGDVGWNTDEEISASSPNGGNNFGWPCYQGFLPTPEYPDSDPANSGCQTIGTPENPGDLTAPFISWNHWDPDASIPPGYIGNCTVGGAFHVGAGYPTPFRNGFFFGDFVQGWIRMAKMDEFDQLASLRYFGGGASGPVDFEIDPANGDLCFVSRTLDQVFRIHYTLNPADADKSGTVDIDDLFSVINNWGPCSPPKGLDYCPADVTDNGEIDIDDLFMVINNWG